MRSLSSQLVVLLSTLVIVASCSSTQPGTSASSSQPDTVQASFITARTLDDLIRRSPIVVVGQVTGTGAIINMARDVNNVTSPDPNLFGVGQPYTVSVSRYLKGTGDGTLQVLQAEGMIDLRRAKVTEQTIVGARATYPYVPMRSGVTYVLFLMPLSDFPDAAYYAGTVNPWRFTAPQDGLAEPESAWAGARGAFPPLPTAQFLSLLEQLIVASPEQ